VSRNLILAVGVGKGDGGCEIPRLARRHARRIGLYVSDMKTRVSHEKMAKNIRVHSN
jgi:hypothetical protein